MKGKINQPAKGHLLISEPFLPDPNFKRTVILLTEHNEEGSVGFVLNKQTNITLNKLMTDFSDFSALVSYGGPVEPNTLHFLHKTGDILEGSIEIMKGVYWGGNFEALKILANTGKLNPSDFKFFIGYSGWGPGQLMDEIKANSWFCAPSVQEYCFLKNPENLWRKVLKNMGNEYSVISNFPEDPSLN